MMALSTRPSSSAVKAEVTRKCTGAVSACRRESSWQLALSLLSQVEVSQAQPDVIIYTAVISTCERVSRWQQALRLLDRLEEQELEPDLIVYNAVISACEKGGQWQPAALCLSDMQDASVRSDVITYNATISSLEKGNQWQKAFSVLSDIEQKIRPAVITYNASITASGRGGQWQLALELLDVLEKRSLERTAVSSSSAVCSCARAAQWELALSLMSKFQAQDLLANAIVLGAAISACENRGRWQHALSLLCDMHHKRIPQDVIVYGAVISACEKAGQWSTALGLLSEFLIKGGQPDVIAFNATISACEKGSQWLHAATLLQQMHDISIQGDVVTISAAISAYEKGGRWQDALALLTSVLEHDVKLDVIAHAAAISACERGSCWKEALHLLESSCAQKQPVNDVAFDMSLRACQKGSQWSHAARLLQTLQEDYLRSAGLAFGDPWHLRPKTNKKQKVEDADPDFDFVLDHARIEFGRGRHPGATPAHGAHVTYRNGRCTDYESSGAAGPVLLALLAFLALGLLGRGFAAPGADADYEAAFKKRLKQVRDAPATPAPKKAQKAKKSEPFLNAAFFDGRAVEPESGKNFLTMPEWNVLLKLVGVLMVLTTVVFAYKMPVVNISGREVIPRLGTASVITAAVTIERMISQSVRTSSGRLPAATLSDRWSIFRGTIGKQAALNFLQFGITREMRLALDHVVPPSVSIMFACGAVGVPFSSLQYNWTIQDTYRHFKVEPPVAAGFLGFVRQNVAPGIFWAFLRAGCGTGGSLYWGPSVADQMQNRAKAYGLQLPGPLCSFLAGLATGASGSLATQWIHNVSLVAGRMSALGETTQAPHYTTAALYKARRELGLSLVYANFGSRMAINAVSVALLNACDIFIVQPA
ncbi:unnamed protein product [Symbiodinium necroappetens]|uniref:Pentatricopeptide repeat-containing protein, chloroplastic n=1 Tax=Symbiodinium necroappetens TaxID=1628268 RepID=A0A812L6E3_9DINO|nr:unnamed protein product [Symbiodinium necroappetens]